jgi:hypothetical protein
VIQSDGFHGENQILPSPECGQKCGRISTEKAITINHQNKSTTEPIHACIIDTGASTSLLQRKIQGIKKKKMQKQSTPKGHNSFNN